MKGVNRGLPPREKLWGYYRHKMCFHSQPLGTGAVRPNQDLALTPIVLLCTKFHLVSG